MERYFRYLLPTKLLLISCVWRVYCVADTLSPTLQRLCSIKLRVSENVIWSVDWHVTGLRAIWCGECVNGVQMGQDETHQCSAVTRDHRRAALYQAILWADDQPLTFQGHSRGLFEGRTMTVIRRYCITLKTLLKTGTLAETRTVYETQVAVVSYCVRLTYACLLCCLFLQSA